MKSTINLDLFVINSQLISKSLETNKNFEIDNILSNIELIKIY